jgi:tetratricopeptide (TPR) repeat protein
MAATMKRIRRAPSKPKAGRDDRSLASLERAVELGATPDNLCRLGLAYGRLQRFEQAKEILARAILLNPTRAESVYQLGLVLVDAGDLPRALICLTRAADLEPDSVPVRRALDDPASDEPRVSELPALGTGRITLGCFNNFVKLNRDVFELWARVLNAVPDSSGSCAPPTAGRASSRVRRSRHTVSRESASNSWTSRTGTTT